jgi:tetratricopeptide (TPR) repeat protein
LLPPVVVGFRPVQGPFFPAFANNNPRPAVLQPVVEAPVNPIDRLPPAPVFADGADGPDGGDLKRAWRYIDYGDRYLREGKLRSAYSRYRKAQDAAPELADVYFRQAFVELALDNIGKSAASLRRGLRLDPRWPQSGFRLDTVYSDEGRRAALTLLDEQLDKFPNDADARLLAGVMLHFHGEDAAAQEQFQRAVKVTGGQSVARLFLPEQPEAQDAAELLK